MRNGGDTEGTLRVWDHGDTWGHCQILGWEGRSARGTQRGHCQSGVTETQCHTVGRWGHSNVGTPPEFGVTVLREHRWELGSQCGGDTDGNWGHSAVGTLTGIGVTDGNWGHSAAGTPTGIGVTVLWGHRWELGTQCCGDTDGNWGHSAVGTLMGIGDTDGNWGHSAMGTLIGIGDTDGNWGH